MSNILFYLVVFLIFVWVVFNRLREDKKWISIMVERGNNCYKLNEKYAYLKANSIRCRIKIVGEMGTDRSVARGMVNVRDMQTVSLDVYYKDMRKAEQLLNK